jgi:hypothetical protein
MNEGLEEENGRGDRDGMRGREDNGWDGKNRSEGRDGRRGRV